MVREGLAHPLLEISAGLAGVAREVLALDDVEVRKGRGRAERMGRIGVAVGERPVLLRALLQHPPDPLADDSPGERLVGRREPLGDRHQIRLDVVVGRAE